MEVVIRARGCYFCSPLPLNGCNYQETCPASTSPAGLEGSSIPGNEFEPCKDGFRFPSALSVRDFSLPITTSLPGGGTLHFTLHFSLTACPSSYFYSELFSPSCVCNLQTFVFSKNKFLLGRKTALRVFLCIFNIHSAVLLSDTF